MRFFTVIPIAGLLSATVIATTLPESPAVAAEAMIAWKHEFARNDSTTEREPLRLGAQANSSHATAHLVYGRLQAEIMRHLAETAREEDLRSFHEAHQARYRFRSPVHAVVVFFPPGFDSEVVADIRSHIVQQHSSKSPWSEFITVLEKLIKAPTIIREIVLFQDEFDRDDHDGEAILSLHSTSGGMR
jgi:hypothetical protein